MPTLSLVNKISETEILLDSIVVKMKSKFFLFSQ